MNEDLWDRLLDRHRVLEPIDTKEKHARHAAYSDLVFLVSYLRRVQAQEAELEREVVRWREKEERRRARKKAKKAERAPRKDAAEDEEPGETEASEYGIHLGWSAKEGTVRAEWAACRVCVPLAVALPRIGQSCTITWPCGHAWKVEP